MMIITTNCYNDHSRWLPWPERRIIVNHGYHEQGSVARVVGYPTKRLEKSLPRKSWGGESQLHHQDFHQCYQHCPWTLTSYYIHGNIATITIAFSYKMENNQVWTWMKQCQEDVRFWWADKVFRGNIVSDKERCEILENNRQKEEFSEPKWGKINEIHTAIHHKTVNTDHIKHKYILKYLSQFCNLIILLLLWIYWRNHSVCKL